MSATLFRVQCVDSVGVLLTGPSATMYYQWNINESRDLNYLYHHSVEELQKIRIDISLNPKMNSVHAGLKHSPLSIVWCDNSSLDTSEKRNAGD